RRRRARGAGAGATLVPGLPAVGTVRRSRAPVLTGRRIEDVRVRGPRLRAPLPRTFAARLVGRRIEGLSRSGKYLLATLDDGHVWLVHLGMTGRLTLGTDAASGAKHDHVVIRLDDGHVLTYHDPRRFGRMDVLAPAALAAV